MGKKEIQEPRREFLKKVGYTTPVILTVAALPAVAKSGSGFLGGRHQGGHPHGGFHRDRHHGGFHSGRHS